MTICAGINIGCGLTEIASDAVTLVDRAIDTIHNDSTKWQSALQELAEDLPDEVQSTIRNEVAQLLERSIAQAGVEIRCETDFIALRVVQGLEKIKAELLGTEPPKLAPGFCHVVPSMLNMNLPPESRTAIEIAGWDMDQLDSSGMPVSVLLISDSTGEVVQLGEDRIGRTTHYWMTLNVFGLEFDQLIQLKKITKVQLSWNGNTDGLPQVIVLPRVPKVDSILIPMGESTLVPQWTGVGDTDFDTSPSEPMYVKTWAQTKIEGNKILVQLYMWAKEGEPDYTTAESLGGWQTAYVAPPGWRIKSAQPIGKSAQSLTITTHGAQEIKLPQGEVVNRFEIYGDHDGSDAGSYTRVIAYFNSANVELEEILP